MATVQNGEMPERLNGPVSKTGVGATLPGVQIPLSPPLFKQLATFLSTTLVTLAVRCLYCVPSNLKARADKSAWSFTCASFQQKSLSSVSQTQALHGYRHAARFDQARSSYTELELVNHTNTDHIVSRDASGFVEPVVFIQQVDFVINIGGEVFVEVVVGTH